EAAETSLQDAIQRVVGKPGAWVVLRNASPITVPTTKPLVVSGGAVTIRAGDGSQPVLNIRLLSPTALFQVRSNGGLKLSGLTIELSYGGARAPIPPALIESANNLVMERCAFVAAPDAREVQVISSKGGSTTVSGCWFEGFDRPLAIRAFP